jgi:tRNA (adenine57-N1/adenine58-N1)-methyltransferase catalytic subunit
MPDTSPRRPLAPGDKVQLTDAKGRMHTVTLVDGARFHTDRGYLSHDDIIGRDEGFTALASNGRQYQVLRPLYPDYVLSMPRGATIVYPKDTAQILVQGDIAPGSRVIEAGVGSGGLTIALLRAVGPTGRVLSIERRADFVDVARANVEDFLGGAQETWEVVAADFQDEALARARAGERADRVVLDMLAPWECLDAAHAVLEPGGVLTCYVATVTQLSRTAEALRDHGGFTEPDPWESFVRPWHLDGLSVRPEHRMVAHTGFLLTARRLADGAEALHLSRRPAPGARPERDDHDPAGAAAPTADMMPAATTAATPTPTADAMATSFGGYTDEEWDAEQLGERGVSAKKVRRTLRDQRRGGNQRWQAELPETTDAPAPEEEVD